jgi:DNA-binding MarR family transcriptional regulator
MWLQILSLHGNIFTVLNSALGAEFGLSLAKFDVLAQLDRYPDGLALGQLSQNLKVSGGNVSGLVQRLLADNLISKEMSREDRRSFIVRLTPKGAALFGKASAVHKQQLDRCFEHVPTKQLNATSADLKSISATMQFKRKAKQ